jgi:hypothetical protein
MKMVLQKRCLRNVAKDIIEDGATKDVAETLL